MIEDQRSEAERREDAIRLLEDTHEFPCAFMFKVIGLAEDHFVDRVVDALCECHHSIQDPPYRTRQTPNGKHIAVTLEPHIESADVVLLIYRELQTVQGVVLVM